MSLGEVIIYTQYLQQWGSFAGKGNYDKNAGLTTCVFAYNESFTVWLTGAACCSGRH